MVNLAVVLDILKLLKKYNIRTLSVKIKEKQRLSRVKILLSYQAVETKYGLSRVKTILSHLHCIKIGIIEAENGLFFSRREI
jgi:acetolactate synthase small subunit